MKYKAFIILCILVLGLLVPIVFVSDVRTYLASLFFANDLTSEDVRAHYQQGNVSILIVPGHDSKNYGTWYKGMKEADLVAEIGENLYEYLARDGRFNVTLARNRNGYTQEFSDYFTKQKNNIAFFIRSVWTYFNELARTQQIAISPQKVRHNRVNRKTQIALYGINKWANDHNMDIVLHLHLNDYGGRRSWERKYDGFSIYIPSKELPNHEVSQELAHHLREVFSRYWAASSLPVEKSAIIESPLLIATGAAGSLRSAGVLMEYGYIYESRFHTDLMLKEAAFRTYQGLLAFFEDGEKIADDLSWVFPYEWEKNISFESRLKEDIAAAQAALFELGFYPPPGMSKRRCPVNGNFRTCTKIALRNFQKQMGISGNGEFGPKTRAALNKLF